MLQSHPAGPDRQCLVSVIIPAKNAAPTLRRAIQSVIEQDYAPIEIIVVDDGSRDDTAAVAASFAGVRVIRHAESQGAAAARNAGVAAAHGEAIAFQDADDEWLPGKLRGQMALLRSDERMVFVACAARLIGVDGQDRGPLYENGTPVIGDDTWRGLLARNTIGTPCVVVWRRALIELGGFKAALPVGEDQDMWIRLSLHGRFGYIDEPLVRVHATPRSLSGVGSQSGAHMQLQVTIPMIRGHIAAQRHRLSRQEVRRILGERLGRAGRAAYSYQLYAEGLPLVLEAMLLGYRPLENLLFLAIASPPARWLKQRMGFGSSAGAA